MTTDFSNFSEQELDDLFSKIPIFQGTMEEYKDASVSAAAPYFNKAAAAAPRKRGTPMEWNRITKSTDPEERRQVKARWMTLYELRKSINQANGELIASRESEGKKWKASELVRMNEDDTVWFNARNSAILWNERSVKSPEEKEKNRQLRKEERAQKRKDDREKKKAEKLVEKTANTELGQKFVCGTNFVGVGNTQTGTLQSQGKTITFQVTMNDPLHA